MNRHTAKRLTQSSTGFTIMEIQVATVILLPIFAGVMYTFVKGMELNELSRNRSEATRSAQSRLVEIENTAYSQISSTFNSVSFSVSEINGTGVTYVDTSDPDVLGITASVSWQERNGRVVGEDQNLNGQIDGGEDANGNGILDSPVMISTRVIDT